NQFAALPKDFCRGRFFIHVLAPRLRQWFCIAGLFPKKSVVRRSQSWEISGRLGDQIDVVNEFAG
ncbi:MAG: hypothetical protein DWI29_01415, partial [Planctomycetota bacterium]